MLGAVRQMLHARRLSFLHPADRRPMRVTAPAPADFRSAMRDFC